MQPTCRGPSGLHGPGETTATKKQFDKSLYEKKITYLAKTAAGLLLTNVLGQRGGSAQKSNKDKKGFLIDLDLNLRENLVLEYQTSYNKLDRFRKVMINNKEIAAKHSRKTIPMLWIAPYTEKIFTGSAMLRRNFLPVLNLCRLVT